MLSDHFYPYSCTGRTLAGHPDRDRAVGERDRIAGN